MVNLMKARVYRDVPTSILRSLIARNEYDGFGDGKYTKAMRGEMLWRAFKICPVCYGNGNEGGASAAVCESCNGSGVAPSIKEG